MPELMQGDCTAENLVAALKPWFENGLARATLGSRGGEPVYVRAQDRQFFIGFARALARVERKITANTASPITHSPR